ncbi:hypothetical protein [Enterococcus faecium]|nr:hypothetical protein [Enterococcus faecium]
MDQNHPYSAELPIIYWAHARSKDLVH